MRRLFRSRAVAGLALLAALALALSACSGGGEDSTADAAPAAPDTKAMAAFQSCMEENGASMPDAPPATDSGASAQPPQMPAPDSDTQAALDACSDLMPAPPSGAPPSGAGVPTPPASSDS
jgi:hypothetical protein